MESKDIDLINITVNSNQYPLPFTLVNGYKKTNMQQSYAQSSNYQVAGEDGELSPYNRDHQDQIHYPLLLKPM